MNPLAFSTLACPTWTFDRILQAAQEYGYQALELRGLQDEMDLPYAEPFTSANRNATRQRVEDAGLSICCVSSSGIVANANLDHVKRHAELAHDLGCPIVRVFGGKLPEELPHAEAVSNAAATLRSFGDAAQEAHVSIVLETHDSFSKGEQVAELLNATQHPAVFSLWDLHHPYRQGETPETTYNYLKSSLRYVHVKDSKDGVYTLMGEGDVPLEPMLKLVLDGGYTGPLSVEWEKRWHPTIADPETALPQYAKALRAYMEQH
ncbi:MAG: sugar phosphate isomerase/epimerase [Abitibacteriaceae bacterium]|nr:sugar phosphate isomerase/epimerase [Abditibacteriaceae bacterium]